MEAQTRSRFAGSCLIILGLLIFACLPGQLTAQMDRGSITGTVLDPTGAVVPNVKIVLTNNATNVGITTESTQTGTYVFDRLLPGIYTIEAEQSGFQKFVAKDLSVHVQMVLTQDIHLVTGSVQETVTVTGASPLLEAANAAVGQTITDQAVANLPLVTRDWGSLAQLSAGVATAAPNSVTPNSGTTASSYFSVNGVNLWQNDFRLNGINDNIEIYGGNYTGTNAAIVPPPDAIQEFKVQSGDFNAEFGHSTGAVVNVAIKSGTNALHGNLWEYLRNDVFNANYFFNRTCTSSGCTSKPIPEYRQNIFGGTVGGPVIIPGVYNGKDKTFWFFDYQGQRYVQPVPYTATVPTAGMISSGFTNLQDNITYNSGSGTDALGRKFPHGTILDPATTRSLAAGARDPISGLVNSSANTIYVRDPFYHCTTGGCNAANYAAGGPLTGITDFTTAGQMALLNIIPTGRIDPNAVKLLGLYPAPTLSGALANNFTWVPKQSQNNDTWDIRIDENINAKNILFGVFDRSLFTRNVPGNLPGLAVGQGGARTDSLPAYAWAVGYTRIFTPTLTNEMHVGMVHSDKIQRSIYGNTFGIPAQYGIQGVQQVANNGGIPPFYINGFSNLGVGNYTPTLQYVYSLEGADSVTKLYRNHAFKMGIQIDDLVGDISQPPQGRGNFNFNGQFTDIPNINSNLVGVGQMLLSPITSLVSPNGMAGVNYVGGMNQFSGSNIAATDDQRWYWGAYAQDDWKITPKLTLNLGLRWDYFTPYAETKGRQANFIAKGGNGNTGIYYMSTKGCAVARSTSFNNLLASSGIALNCVPDLALGNAQKTNFSPRVGFAYRLTPTMVVRGGFGTAYGALGNLGYGGTLGTNYPFVYVAQFPAPDSQHPLLLSNGHPATLEESFTTVNFQDPTVNSGQGLNLYGRQFNFQTPYVQTENFTIQKQFTSHDALEVGYVGSQGRHLDNLGYSNSNTQFLRLGANPQNYIPFPSFGRNATYESTNATSNYNSLQTTYEHRLSAGLYLLTNYTWSKCMTDQRTQAGQYQGGYRAEWLPGFGVKGDYGLCDADATNIFHLSGSWNLPFGRGERFLSNINKAADLAVGGWVFNFIYSFQSGQPTTVTCATATSASFGCYANVVSGQSLYSGPHNYTQWLNPKAFAQPPNAVAIGTTDYAAQSDFSPLGGIPQQVRGPHYNDLDSSILKNFTVTETVYFQFRAEAFNTFNTPPFGQPGNLNQYNNINPTTGQVQGGFSAITSTKNSNGNNGARSLQLALKMFF